MKKTIAAISASILGVGTAAVAGAAPAQAALPECATASDHVVNTAVDPSTDNWYMTCIPQYGMGKAEFTITTPASDPFPAAYKLTDGKQTITSSAPTQTQVAKYFGTDFWDEHNSTTGYPNRPTFLGAFMNPELTGQTPTSQTYGHDSSSVNLGQSVAYRIASVGRAASLPAACSPAREAYQGQYEVKYAPTTTTFTQTLKGVKRKVTVTYTPSPLFLGLNFDTTGDGNDTSGFDNTQPLCASSGGVTVQAASSTADSSSWFGVSEDAATNNATIVTTLVPQPTPENEPPATPSLGNFRVTSTRVPVTPRGPELALTGVDPVPSGTLGGALLIAGIGSYLFGRRRRRSSATVR